MLLQWVEVDEAGQETTKSNPVLSIENAASYAKNTCQTCWSKGYNLYDDGWQYYMRSTDKDENTFCDVEVYQVMDRKPINPRILTCSCVDRHIERYGL